MRSITRKEGIVKRSIAIIIFFICILILASACYAQTLDQLITERDKLTKDLPVYRVQAEKNIREAEVKLIQLNAIIADRKKVAVEMAVVEKALEEAEEKAAEVVEAPVAKKKGE